MFEEIHRLPLFILIVQPSKGCDKKYGNSVTPLILLIFYGYFTEDVL